jgi:hypothetical protein
MAEYSNTTNFMNFFNLFFSFLYVGLIATEVNLSSQYAVKTALVSLIDSTIYDPSTGNTRLQVGSASDIYSYLSTFLFPVMYNEVAKATS